MKKKVLIIEDTAAFAFALARMLCTVDPEIDIRVCKAASTTSGGSVFLLEVEFAELSDLMCPNNDCLHPLSDYTDRDMVFCDAELNGSQLQGPDLVPHLVMSELYVIGMTDNPDCEPLLVQAGATRVVSKDLLRDLELLSQLLSK
jgi:hypothetical protein